MVLGKLFEVIILIRYFYAYEFEQAHTSKQKVGHCVKTMLQIFSSLYNSKYVCSINVPCRNSAKISSGSGEGADFVIFAILVTVANLDIRSDPIFPILTPWNQVMLHMKFENCKSSGFIEQDV